MASLIAHRRGAPGSDSPVTDTARDEWLSETEENEATLRERLDSCDIRVLVDPSCFVLGLAIANLVARMAPNVTLVGSGDTRIAHAVFGTGQLSEIAMGMVATIRPARPVRVQTRYVIAAGTSAPGADLYASADRWNVRLSRFPHAPLKGNGLGVAAAAAITASQFLLAILQEIPGRRLASDAIFEWNLVDYRDAIFEGDLPIMPCRAALFGCGSVGSSLIYSLLLGGVGGLIDAVDTDKLSVRNRFRYPLWTTADSGPKVAWVARSARESALAVRPHEMTAAKYLQQQSTPIRLAIAAVDTAEARRDITDGLARVTLNAGIDGLKCHVSRHSLGDGFACAYCQYVDLGSRLDEVDVYVELTGLPEARVIRLLSGEALIESDVRHLVTTGRLLKHEASDALGGRLQDIARQRLYAEAAVASRDTVTSVAAPFVPAVCGAILAAELAKPGDGSGPNSLNRRVDVDCSGLPTGIQSSPAPDRSGRCLCASDYRRRAYDDLWGRTER